MLKGKNLATAPRKASPAPSARSGMETVDAVGLDAFLSAIAHVLVDEPVYHQFAGAIDRAHARSIWTWFAREIAPEDVARLADAIDSGAEANAAFDLLLPDFLEKLKAALAEEEGNSDLERRNTIQMGGEAARKRLPYVIMAMRRRPLLEQAVNFGNAVGSLQDEAALASALQTINIGNAVTRALWMQAMVGYIGNPSRVMAAAVKIAGGPSEAHINHAGFAPLVEAVLSHAQGQIGKLASQPGVFSDLDLACKAVDRYHRLMRAINHTLEIERKSHWGAIITDLTGKISERLDRPMREITVNVTQAMRRPREGADRIDADRVLAGLNGLFLLMTVRHCRDSLAVNALLDQAWSETGQAIEVLVARALDMYRTNPADPVLRERLDAGIKMAEIRYNAEYADILRRARDGADKRMAGGQG